MQMSCIKAPSRMLLSLTVFAGVVLAIRYTTLAHPYLLADNRHVPFYLWRWILRHETVSAMVCKGTNFRF